MQESNNTRHGADHPDDSDKNEIVRLVRVLSNSGAYEACNRRAATAADMHFPASIPTLPVLRAWGA